MQYGYPFYNNPSHYNNQQYFSPITGPQYSIPSPEIIGEGEVTSVMYPDGTIQYFFLPRISGTGAYPYRNNSAWFIRSISNPQFKQQQQNFYGSQTCMNSPLSQCVEPSQQVKSYQLKFHNDTWTSTTDLHYFFPRLRQCEWIPKLGAAVQVELPVESTNIYHYQVTCERPCNCSRLQVNENHCNCLKRGQLGNSVEPHNCPMSNQEAKSEKFYHRSKINQNLNERPYNLRPDQDGNGEQPNFFASNQQNPTQEAKSTQSAMSIDDDEHKHKKSIKSKVVCGCYEKPKLNKKRKDSLKKERKSSVSRSSSASIPCHISSVDNGNKNEVKNGRKTNNEMKAVSRSSSENFVDCEKKNKSKSHRKSSDGMKIASTSLSERTVEYGKKVKKKRDKLECRCEDLPPPSCDVCPSCRTSDKKVSTYTDQSSSYVRDEKCGPSIFTCLQSIMGVTGSEDEETLRACSSDTSSSSCMCHPKSK